MRILALLLPLSAAALFAQHNHAAGAAQPAMLLPGMGNLHHPIATSSPEAQKYFDQGLAFLFAFNHDEAIRSFKHAAALDPECAMAHWGVSIASGPHYNKADLPPDRAKQAWASLQLARARSATA